MPPRACLSPRSGVRRRKDGSTRAVWPSGRPLPPARIRPNPPNPGQMARFPGKNRSPERRRGRPTAFALPPPLRKTGPRPPQQHAAKGPFTRRRPPPTPKLQTRKPTPAPLWTSALLQGDRNPPESVIGSSERVIGIVGMRIVTEDERSSLAVQDSAGLAKALRGFPGLPEPVDSDGEMRVHARLRGVGSLPEEIGVGASAHQMQFVTPDVVDHEPIGLDVRLPVSLPNAPKWMIAEPFGQRLLRDQQLQQYPQLAQILASRPGFSDVAFELRGSNRDQHVRYRDRGTAARRYRSAGPCRRQVPSWPRG